MDVRGRRLRKQSDESGAFTSSTVSDERIAAHVIRINMAHMVSLLKAGAVPRDEGVETLRFLTGLTPPRSADRVCEDYHQRLEQDAVDALGVKTAGYLNLGKSRNDQVATAIRMELRDRVAVLVGEVIRLQEGLLKLAQRKGSLVFPGYTHLQRAQPVTVAHYAFAYFEAFQRSVERLYQLYERVNVSPMGSAALGGTGVRLDRDLVARLLGFDGTTGNAMDSVASRDLAIEALSCATIVMVDISRMAEEQILWSSNEFGFVELPDEFSASSSIMPQKKNPVVAEMGRAKAGSVLGSLVSAVAIAKALPNAYNLDLQEVTPHLWRALDDTIASVRLVGVSYSTMKFDEDRMADSLRDGYSTATALADYLVKTHSISFREAHAVVGELVRLSLERGLTLEEAAWRLLPEASKVTGKKMEIDLKAAKSVLDPGNFVANIASAGGANPSFVPENLARYKGILRRSRDRLDAKASRAAASRLELLAAAKSSTREVKIKK